MNNQYTSLAFTNALGNAGLTGLIGAVSDANQMIVCGNASQSKRPPGHKAFDYNTYQLTGNLPDHIKPEVSIVARANGFPGGGWQIRFWDTGVPQKRVALPGAIRFGGVSLDGIRALLQNKHGSFA